MSRLSFWSIVGCKNGGILILKGEVTNILALGSISKNFMDQSCKQKIKKNCLGF